MRKIYLSTLLSILTLCFGITALAENRTYPDINEQHAYFQAISVFTLEGIVEGYPDGTFKPDQPINRAEALKVILNAFNKDDFDLPYLSFPDVNEDDWFYKFVQQGVKHNIVEGYIDGTFQPANQVLFSESVKMALVARGYNFDEVEYEEFHPSVTTEDWFHKHMSLAYQKNFINLEPNGSLNPNRPMNRGEFVDLVYKIRATDRDDSFDISYNWSVEANRNGIVVQVPFSWQYFNLGEGVFLGFFAGQNPTFVRNVQNGARISINFWENPENKSASEYFERIRLEFENDYRSLDIEFREENKNFGESLTVFIERMGIFNLYVYLESGTVLVAEGAFDQDSLKASDLIKEIEKIYEKIEFDPRYNLTASQKLEEARKNINVQGKGMDTIQLFNSYELIFTDTFGVGTGPVDYYFLPGANNTIKYERTYDVILDVLIGRNCEVCEE